MIEELEWGGAQQLMLLLQSGVLGVGLGVVFDLMTGVGRDVSKIKRFFLDLIFCVLAALVTFFFSLVITDGKMHPILFLGCLLGMAIEHCVIGKRISRVVYKSVRGIRYLSSVLTEILKKHFFTVRKMIVFPKREAKNVKKIRKKRNFFQKKA